MHPRQVYNFFRNVVCKRRVAQDLDDEISTYLELLADEKARSGIDRVEALQQARRELGGMEQVKEDVRDLRVGVTVDRLFQDLRYGLRLLRRSPGFAATAILTLALGIGATTAIFSVVDAVLFKPLAFPNADRLVRVESVVAATGHGGVASYPDFQDWQTRNDVFDGLAVFRTNDFTLTGTRNAEHMEGGVVSAKLFQLLGARPAIGRSFLPEENEPGKAGGTDAVILSYGLWQREFGSAASAIGRVVELGNQAYTVVGVMPAGFQFPIQAEPIEIWTTIAIDARGGANAITTQRGAHYLDVVGLLKPGVKLARAQNEMASIAGALSKEHPENKPRTARVVPEVQGLVGPLRTPLLILLGAVGFVLLIVVVNVANLLLARATRRYKEMSVRAALGATRARTVCQLLTESLTLSLLGGALGLALAVSSIRLLVRIMPEQAPRAGAAVLDERLLGFALLISVVAGVLFGLVPALSVSKTALAESLNERWGGSNNVGKGQTRVRGVLVIGEIALAVVLLLGASLLLQSFIHLTRADAGFDPHHVLTFQLDAPSGRSPQATAAFFRNVIARLSTIPGVQTASAAAALPLMGDNMKTGFDIEQQAASAESRPTANFNAVEPNYFRSAGIRLLGGRDFTPYDDSRTTPVVIVNHTLAQRFFANQNPIGKHVRPGIGNGYGPGELPMREIVGVIADLRQSELGEESVPEIYAPLAQSPFPSIFFTLRALGHPQGLAEDVRRKVASVDNKLPIYHLETLDEYFAQSLLLPRFLAFLLSGFAILALLLACLGVYGVVSYVTNNRTHEIGIRMALGSRQGEVVRMMVAEGLRPSLAGILIGVAGALKLTAILASLLFGIGPTDPLTFVGVSLVLFAVALLACYVPARRAAAVDPALSLRHE